MACLPRDTPPALKKENVEIPIFPLFCLPFSLSHLVLDALVPQVRILYYYFTGFQSSRLVGEWSGLGEGRGRRVNGKGKAPGRGEVGGRKQGPDSFLWP